MTEEEAEAIDAERRAWRVACGCLCGGSDLCPDCAAAGATEATRGIVKCDPLCSTLCPVCSPDD